MYRTLTLTVSPSALPQRLDQYLAHQASQFPDTPLFGSSRAFLQKLIAAGDVLVNNHIAKSSTKVQRGDNIVLRFPPPRPLSLVPEAMALDILYEDEHLLAINKPAGLVVHPGAGQSHGTLVHGLLAHCTDLSGIGGVLRPGIVHRLDRGTSGAMVVAKSDRAHEGLAKQFALRETRKIYVATVFGVPAPMTKTIDTFYGRHPTQRRLFSSKLTTGKRAVTSYSVKHSAHGLAWLEVVLGTGRTHQIRVHLADQGHPILGDPEYGGQQWTRIRHLGVRSMAERFSYQALHAKSLGLRHPITNAVLQFEAPLPSGMQDLLDAILQH